MSPTLGIRCCWLLPQPTLEQGNFSFLILSDSIIFILSRIVKYFMEERSSAELKCEILYGGAFQCGTDEVLLIIVVERVVQ